MSRAIALRTAARHIERREQEKRRKADEHEALRRSSYAYLSEAQQAALSSRTVVETSAQSGGLFDWLFGPGAKYF